MGKKEIIEILRDCKKECAAQYGSLQSAFSAPRYSTAVHGSHRLYTLEGET